jgi:hypothetical protein
MSSNSKELERTEDTDGLKDGQASSNTSTYQMVKDTYERLALALDLRTADI